MLTWLKSALSSPTVWTMIGAFVFGGVNEEMKYIPAEYQFIVQGLLLWLATHFHLSTANK